MIRLKPAHRHMAILIGTKAMNGGCLRKRVFSSDEKAREFGEPLGQKPYQCHWCKYWHLSTFGGPKTYFSRRKKKKACGS